MAPIDDQECLEIGPAEFSVGTPVGYGPRLRTVRPGHRTEELVPLLESGHEDQSAIDRVAISRALTDCGYLVVRSRRFVSAIKS